VRVGWAAGGLAVEVDGELALDLASRGVDDADALIVGVTAIGTRGGDVESLVKNLRRPSRQVSTSM